MREGGRWDEGGRGSPRRPNVSLVVSLPCTAHTSTTRRHDSPSYHHGHTRRPPHTPRGGADIQGTIGTVQMHLGSNYIEAEEVSTGERHLAKAKEYLEPIKLKVFLTWA